MSSALLHPMGLRSRTWMVSFADLLTLLLSFFVLILSRDMRPVAQPNETVSDSSEAQQPREEQAAGTPLAVSASVVGDPTANAGLRKTVVLSFAEHELSSDGGLLLEALEGLRTSIKEFGVVRRVELSICPAADLHHSWRTLYGQLLGAQLARGSIGLNVSECVQGSARQVVIRLM